MTAADEQLAELRRRFPLWEVWYVLRVTEKGAVWCANPWAKKDDRRNVLHADKPEHLAEYMTEYQAEHAGQLITGTPPDAPS